MYRRLRQYLHNTSWIMGERILSMGLGFATTVIVARYLGPERFGTLAYALSLASLLGAAGHMGLAGLVVREIVANEDGRGEILGTAAALKGVGMAVGYVVLVGYAIAYEGIGTTPFYLIVLAGAALLLRPVDVIDFWFQAFVQARYTAIARMTSQLTALGFKLLLVFAGAGVTYFATAQLIQAAIAALLLVALFAAKASQPLTSWSFSWRRAKELLSQGWLIYLGSIFAVIYLKVDQIMLRWLSTTEEVGQYAIAAQISEVWYFIPTAIVASFFPKLIKLRTSNEALFKRRLQQLFDVLFLIAAIVAMAVSLSAPALIQWFFGSAYAASASILVIHIWAAIFIFMRAAFSRWILIENVLVFSLLTQGLGAVTNVCLNYFLIPAHGGIGAAYATLISYATAGFLSLGLYGKTREVFAQMAMALLAPVRYPLSLAKRL